MCLLTVFVCRSWRDKRVKREARGDEDPGTSGMESTPVISVHDDDESLLLSHEQVEGHDDEVAQALQNRLVKSDKIDSQSIASEVDSSPPVSSSGTPVPESELAASHFISPSPNLDSRGNTCNYTVHMYIQCTLI